MERDRNNRLLLYMSLIFLLSVIYVLPIILKNRMAGDDIYFHLSRFRFLCEDMKNGSFFSFVHTSMYRNMGYISPVFYPEFLFYPAAMLSLTGMTVLTCYKVYYLYISILTGVSFYFCSRKIFKEENCQNINFKAFIVFLVAFADPYRFINYYLRAAVGEFSSYVFIPIVVLGCYYIIKKNKKPYILGLGMTGLLYSHFLSFIIACYVLAVVVIYNIKTIKNFIFKLFLAACECCAFSAIVILPVAEAFLADKISIFSGSPIKMSIFDSAIINTGLSLIIGAIVLFAIVVYSIIKKSALNRIIQLSLFLILILSDMFPWSFILFKPLSFIQFPWRLLSVFYQYGPRYGVNTLREAVFVRDNYTCKFCGRNAFKDNVILHVHHMLFWKDRHGNSLNELATCCDKCHTPANHQQGGLLWGKELKFKGVPEAAYMNSVRWYIYNEIKKSNVKVHITYGAATKESRSNLKLEKSHINDAYSMGNYHPDDRVMPLYFKKKRRNNRILTLFYDAKYIDSRTGKKVSGKDLYNGRIKRNHNLDSENLHKYRSQKISKGRVPTRTKRYPIRPGDTVLYQGQKYISRGCQNLGMYIKLNNSKVVSIKKVKLIKKLGGYEKLVLV